MNVQVTAEWIAQQREICDVRIAKMLGKFEHNAYDYNIDGRVLGVNISEFKGYMLLAGLCSEVLPAALDALESSMAREAEKEKQCGIWRKASERLADHEKDLQQTIARLTAERDAAVCDLKYLSGEYKLCDTCKHNHGKGVWDCNDGLCDKENHYEWRGPTSANTDAPTGAESEGAE
jgi:hypothetical protein